MYRTRQYHVKEYSRLKEVRIKPVGDRFVIDVVMDMEDTGITPIDNDIILNELSQNASGICYLAGGMMN
ncbi:MAG: hypothetical protein K6G27_15600 [Lachnospiraceae bacterium]|nr:hypothetical protein [Lachnospiraceae bacterium]